MPARTLAVPSLGVFLVLAGCFGGASALGTTVSSSVTVDTTATAGAETNTTAAPTTETTSRKPCSLDGNVSLSSVSKPTALSDETASDVAETVASRYQSARVDEHTYFDHHVNVISVESADDGDRVVLRGELDHDERGGENATVVRAHRRPTTSGASAATYSPTP
jgi:hypothetical protein